MEYPKKRSTIKSIGKSLARDIVATTRPTVDSNTEAISVQNKRNAMVTTSMPRNKYVKAMHGASAE